MGKPNSRVSRRSFLLRTASLLAAPAVFKISPVAAKSGSVTITSTGGSFLDMMTKYVFTPFTEETGIKVNPVLSAADLGKVKAMQITGNVEWDIYNDVGSHVAAGSKQGFWEKLDLSMFDLEDMTIPPETDSVTWETYASGITWDPKKYGAGKHPETFSEFLDLNGFPGRRAFRAGNVEALELALLADGVAPKDMYPLDIDRAFKALDRVKSSIVWAGTTPQTVSLVQMGEADFSYTYSSRAKATTLPGGGVPLAFSFKQNLILADSVAVIKGSPNKENALKLIVYMLRPDVQARLEDHLGLLPVSKKAFSMLSAETRKWLFDINSPNNLVVNNAYWADNYDSIWPRFAEWQMTK